MRSYELKLMIAKAGKKPARLGFLDVEADSAQEALEIGNAEGAKILARTSALIGINETTRIWAELA